MIYNLIEDNFSIFDIGQILVGIRYILPKLEIIL